MTKIFTKNGVFTRVWYEMRRLEIRWNCQRYELEAGKWVRVDGWENKAAAIKEIEASIKRYNETK